MAGVDVQAFDAVTRTMIAEHRVRMFSYTANLARILKASHTLVAISGSPLVVVEPFLEGLGFDHVIGSTFQTKGGKFTGVAKSIDKAVALAEFAESDVDISVGIGDTVGDLPVLESAHCAIAFNPSATLRKTAIANGWFIVMEQKDAITQLLPTESGYEAVFDRSPSLILDRAGVVL
jgi:phosphoserine phosphatase